MPMDEFFFDMPLMSSFGAQPSAAGALETARGTRKVPRHINLDIYEEKDKFVITADLPGFDNKEDVSIDVDGDILRLSAEHKGKKEKKSKEGEWPVYHRVERTTDFASRTIRMPENVDMAKLDANMDHGVLTIQAPKVPEEVQVTTRRIAIK